MGAFKLGKMTFGSLFKKPETVLYPLQTKPQPAGLKGHIEVDVTSCILCGMCERSCTTNCISVSKQDRTWSINRFQCIQCGYCITVCPKKCMSMDPNYAPASTERGVDSVVVPEQEKTTKATSAESESKSPAQPAEKPAQPAAGQKAQPANQGDKTPVESDNSTKNAAKPIVVDKQVEAILSRMSPEKASVVASALDAKR